MIQPRKVTKGYNEKDKNYYINSQIMCAKFHQSFFPTFSGSNYGHITISTIRSEITKQLIAFENFFFTKMLACLPDSWYNSMGKLRGENNLVVVGLSFDIVVAINSNKMW